MDTTKLTREEALRRWNASKENKRKMVEKLENLVRKSCLERTGKEPIRGRSMVSILLPLHPESRKSMRNNKNEFNI